ncbi:MULTISPECIES: flagellar hook assembly protein FlgD [Salimicrobium]|uniref:flagellar hook assembly protein FlgD n=1 Tax=Salimicrobium TaxID=351195 RepID=UPI001E3AB05F|nr:MULTISPECIES: flagellar hook assembly protein FlgD [Salimicrobium]
MVELNTIDSTYYLENHIKKRDTQESGTLGKDDFLKILMSQLQNQSPLDPMKDKDFIAQMAQFTQLEQMTNMSNTFEKYFNKSEGSVAEYSHMIAKEIAYFPEEQSEGDRGELKSGVVEAVSLKEGEVFLKLDDGARVPVSSIQEVRNNRDGDQYGT